MKTAAMPDTADPKDDRIVDKKTWARRWNLSTRTVDKFLQSGMPHLKIGSRRVRLIVQEADSWMKEKFATRRSGRVPTAA